MGIVSEGRRITCRREVVCLLNSVPPPGSFFTFCQQEQLFSCRVLFTHDLLLNFLFFEVPVFTSSDLYFVELHQKSPFYLELLCGKK